MTTPMWKRGIWLAAALFLSAASFWAGGLVVRTRMVGRDYLSRGRFAQIESLLHAYHKEHGSFPPIKYRLGNGPEHSWRVLVSRYIDANYEGRSSKYDFSKEWNSPDNMRALSGLDNYFELGPTDKTPFAKYLAVGDGEEWPVNLPLRSRLIVDGKDHFLLVEYPDSKTPWMEPKN